MSPANQWHSVGVDIDIDGPRGWIGLAMNTNLYVNGGAYAVAMFAGSNDLRRPIMMHEAGHSWHNLADEYGGNPDVYAGGEPVECNVSADSTGQKWNHWFDTELTRIGTHNVFEGGRYYDFGMYRPTNDSIMRADLVSGIIIRVLKKSFSIFTAVQPLDVWTPNDEPFTSEFALNVTPVDSNVINVNWYLNDQLLDVNALNLDHADVSLPPGVNVIKAVAYDTIVNHSNANEPHPLDLVRTSLERLRQEVSWNIVSGPVSSISFAQAEWLAGDVLKISLIDNDNVGLGWTVATLTTDQGDNEEIELLEVRPGYFQGMMPTVLNGTVINNGAVDLSNNTIVTAHYVDDDAAGGLAIATTLVKTFPDDHLVVDFSFEENTGDTTIDAVAF